MKTVVPTMPDKGEKLSIFGKTVKLRGLGKLPAGVTTVIGPVVAPAGTTAAISCGETSVNTALTPLNRTAVAPVKLVPLIVTLVPAAPLDGVNPLICGAMKKLLRLVAVPPAAMTVMKPVLAPAGTVAIIRLLEMTVKTAGAPLNFTAVVSVKLPSIVTLVPSAPLSGANAVMTGVD